LTSGQCAHSRSYVCIVGNTDISSNFRIAGNRQLARICTPDCRFNLTPGASLPPGFVHTHNFLQADLWGLIRR
jgi:hypothetical protein